jgi:dephospho-CoA kinase
MRVIGILGGIASGKSFVAEEFARLGAGVLDADRAGHEVLRLPWVEDAARARWGNRVLDADGQIDRSRLAEIVFADSPQGRRERTFLEQLVHPSIARLLQQQVEEMAAAGTVVAVVDAALLLEAGWDTLCEELIFVEAEKKTRLARAATRGWTEEEFNAREAAQQSLDFKRSRAVAIIDNSGSPEQTQAQVARCWHRLTD